MNTVSKGEMKMGEIVIAQIYVNGVTAVASRLKKIPKGIIGATIHVTFGSGWDGLAKTAVFQGAVTKDVLVDDKAITIPVECVDQAGCRLRVGFYGVSGGELVIPTIWADLGMIQDAADPSGDTSTDPTLPVWAQLQAQLAGITGGETATGVQINLNAHTSNTANPHGVTAEQVGAAPANHATDKNNPHGVTAEQVGASPMEYTKKVGNPHNLLDNSDFRNPVNQRGDVQYSKQRGYSLDRWYIYGDGAVPDFAQDAGFWAFNPNGATGASLSQRFSKGVLKSEKTYTLAWKDVYGNIKTRTDCVHFDSAYDFAAIPLDAWAGLVWAALYEGEYTAETLPAYQPKGYGVELAECQRYYRLLNANGLGNGYTTGNGGMSILLLPFSMRSGVQPTFVCDGTIYTRANGVDYASTVDGFATKSGYTELVFMAKGAPVKHAAAFYTDGTKAALSADL